MNQRNLPPRDPDVRRARARRLALWIAVAAMAIYAGFIAMVGLSK